MLLLNKGPKYNLGHKNKGWITTLALEAETAVSQLPYTGIHKIPGRPQH